jgi:hypothetical protein
MEQKNHELVKIEALTIKHHNQNAEAFWNETKNHGLG